ncbi:hypothetical protein ACH5AL_24285 [Actinacidiphila glaucinigra]|uniref:hypothetical protein n=1 Tax=Actinacidiphila glaucinigra TaxID=235986 RepID=UPI00378F87E1
MNGSPGLPPEETDRTDRTLHLGPADAPPADPAPRDASPHDPEPVRTAADPEYSATVLAEHWAPSTLPTARLEPTVSAEGAVPTVKAGPTVVLPDRVEGDVMRFGPGVTPAAAARANIAAEVWRGLTTPPPPPRPAGRRWPRRYALAATVLAAVLLFLAWQRFGPGLAVRGVTVTASPSAPPCDTTVDLVAVVTTNGRPGTIGYRWLRNDGTSSDVLYEEVPRGRHEARLHLLWTFRGQGTYRAQAELRITTPGHRAVTTGFTYDCR